MVDMGEAFFTIVELGTVLGIENIKDLPGCWVHKVDENWTIALNAHNAPVHVDLQVEQDLMPVDVPAFGAAVWWHGWLAGLLTPGAGAIAAHPEGASEERLIADLKAAIQRAGGTVVP